MSADNEELHPAPISRWQKFWLAVDVILALTDQAFDVIMMHEFAMNDDWAYFYIGLGTILAPVVLSNCFGCCCSPVGGCIEDADDESGCYSFVQFVPGLNMLVSASYAILSPRRAFKTKATRMEQVYKQTRAFEAFFEAGPQAVFQVMIALRQVEGIRFHILLSSLALSFISLTKTMVTFFIFEDYTVFFWTRREGVSVYSGNFQRRLQNEFPNNGIKFRMFLLSLFYGLFEVISVVLSVALLGYFCGWYSIVISFAVQYVLLYIYLRAKDLHYDHMSFSKERKGNWRYLLIPILTSFVGGRAIPFKWYLCIRLLIMGAYVAASLLIGRDGADFNFLSEIFVWAAVVTTGLWIFLMPAFVNSCHNLGIAFYSWSEDRYVTDRFTKCSYPLEIKSNDSICSCSFSEKTSELAEKGTDFIANAASTVLESVSL